MEYEKSSNEDKDILKFNKLSEEKVEAEELLEKRREQNIEFAVFQILENADMAIKQFISELNSNISTENQGFFSLHYYGFLQALLNQQDAVLYLYKIKTGETLELPDYLEFIRKIKRQTIGHIPDYYTDESEKCAYITDTYITSDNKFF